LPQS